MPRRGKEIYTKDMQALQNHHISDNYVTVVKRRNVVKDVCNNNRALNKTIDLLRTENRNLKQKVSIRNHHSWQFDRRVCKHPKVSDDFLNACPVSLIQF